MIIDQANAAAESNGRFFNKTNRFESIRPKRIEEVRPDIGLESRFMPTH